MDVNVTVLRHHVPRSERNRVLNILVVGNGRAGDDLGVFKVALNRYPADRPFKLIDRVLALSVDYYI